MDSVVLLLLSASAELAKYIDKENERLKAGISCTDLDPPDYHDYQTCHELASLAVRIRDSGIKWQI